MATVPTIRVDFRWVTEDGIKKLLEACGKSRNRDL